MTFRFLKSALIVLTLTCAIPLVITSTCFAQVSFDFHEGVPLHGKIDSIVTTHFTIKSEAGQNERNLSIQSTAIYNKKGQETDYYIYSTDSNPDLSHVATNPTKFVSLYDNNGNIKEGGSGGNKVTYEYPDKHLACVKHYRHDKLVSTDTMKFDASGKIIENDENYVGQTRYLKRYYKYNKKGFLTEINGVYSDGNYSTKALYNYDSNDNLSKTVTVYPAATVVDTYTYDKLDNHHNWLVKNTFTNGKLKEVIERRIAYK